MPRHNFRKRAAIAQPFFISEQWVLRDPKLIWAGIRRPLADMFQTVTNP